VYPISQCPPEPPRICEKYQTGQLAVSHALLWTPIHGAWQGLLFNPNSPKVRAVQVDPVSGILGQELGVAAYGTAERIRGKRLVSKIRSPSRIISVFSWPFHREAQSQ
jgi:hypothetical protein